MELIIEMKQEFIDYLNKLIAAAPDVAMTDGAKAYIDALLENNKDDKPVLTDNGKLILKYLQDNADTSTWKARSIAEGLFINSRTVSGAMRKLTSDGFCERLGSDPVIYALTEKGKNYKIED